VQPRTPVVSQASVRCQEQRHQFPLSILYELGRISKARGLLGTTALPVDGTPSGAVEVPITVRVLGERELAEEEEGLGVFEEIRLPEEEEEELGVPEETRLLEEEEEELRVLEETRLLEEEEEGLGVLEEEEEEEEEGLKVLEEPRLLEDADVVGPLEVMLTEVVPGCTVDVREVVVVVSPVPELLPPSPLL